MSAPIPETEPHVRAVRQHLDDTLPANVTVTVGGAPTGVAAPLVVLYPDPGDVARARISGKRSLTLRVFVHAVGAGPEQALWVGDQARKALLGTPPAVPGRTVYPLAQTLGGMPLSRDDDVQPPLFVQVTEYEMRSDPAA